MSFITKPNLKKRIIATFLDYAIIFLSAYIYINLFGAKNDEGVMQVTGLKTFPVFIGWFLYFVVVEACYGATFAHQAFLKF